MVENKKEKRIKQYVCPECGHIATERYFRKVARSKGYPLNWTPTCPQCGCSEWNMIVLRKEVRSMKCEDMGRILDESKKIFEQVEVGYAKEDVVRLASKFKDLKIREYPGGFTVYVDLPRDTGSLEIRFEEREEDGRYEFDGFEATLGTKRVQYLSVPWDKKGLEEVLPKLKKRADSLLYRLEAFVIGLRELLSFAEALVSLSK